MAWKRVLEFWFKECSPEDWFQKNEDFDNKIKAHFSATLEEAKNAELWEWRQQIQGRLAEIIVLDQFSRNIYRNDPRSFSQDSLALILAQEAILQPEHEKLSTIEKSFLYMPFMHSESKKMHEQAVKLFAIPGLEYNYEFELKHKKIIDRFGRYPHRNKILGRTSTTEEIAFLKEPNSSF